MGKENENTKKNQARFLEILEKKGGNITQACKGANIGRQTYYDWMHQEPKSENEFSKAVDVIQESLIDDAESLLRRNMHGEPIYKTDTSGAFVLDSNGNKIKTGYLLKPDNISTIFFLKTKAKHRGYIEKTETDITTGGEKITGIEVNIKQSDETKD